MVLNQNIRKLMISFLQRHGGDEQDDLIIEGEDSWTLDVSCELSNLPQLHIRCLNSGDVPAMLDFSMRLSPMSKFLFCPYPWDDAAKLRDAFQQSIRQAAARIDASYLMEIADNRTIGHFFLWKAGGNSHSQRHGVQVPELGVAVADEFQGHGLGTLAVRFLQAVAESQHADAIELTTALSNEAGWRTYRRCGFEYVGLIDIPLAVDVTAAAAGEVEATEYRQERQMVFLLNEDKRDQVLDYLAAN